MIFFSKKKMLLVCLLGTVFFLLTSFPLNAEMYKYRDENGVLIYTDDLSSIPKSQREDALELDEVTQAAEGNMEKVSVEELAPAKEDDKNPEDTQNVREQLEEEIADLNKELEGLNAEKQKLMEQKEQADTYKERKDFNETAAEFNKKIEAYNKKKTQLEEKIAAYNSRFESEEE